VITWLQRTRWASGTLRQTRNIRLDLN